MRRSRMKSFDVATQVAKGFWEVVALAGKLLWALRTSCKWIIMTIRLIVFVGLLLPAFMGMFGYWLCSKTVKKNIEYGKNPRNLLDIYTDDSEQLKPVVVFFSGGAWIIGYKAWGCLMGKVLANCGIVFVTPDYRNFPQGNIPEMIEDGNAAMEWVFENIHVHGGDKQRVTLMGQSAGAHIAACILLDQVCCELEGEFVMWKPLALKYFIGISGPYNIEMTIEEIHRRGLDRKVVLQIMNNDIAFYSPTLRMKKKSLRKNAAALLPPMALYHGTADVTVNCQSTSDFEKVLKEAGVQVSATLYSDKTHTDPIIEDPMMGEDTLLKDVLALLADPEKIEMPNTSKMLPLWCIRLARRVNPF